MIRTVSRSLREKVVASLEKVPASFVLLLSTMLSFGGIAVAWLLQRPLDAGRGGALAVALSFLFLFLNFGRSQKTFAILSEEASELEGHLATIERQARGSMEARMVKLERRVEGLVAAMRVARRIDGKSQLDQNIILAVSSVIGTLAWGFGDLIAALR